MIFIGNVFYSKYFKTEKTIEMVSTIDNKILEEENLLEEEELFKKAVNLIKSRISG